MAGTTTWLHSHCETFIVTIFFQAPSQRKQRDRRKQLKESDRNLGNIPEHGHHKAFQGHQTRKSHDFWEKLTFYVLMSQLEFKYKLFTLMDFVVRIGIPFIQNQRT